MGGQKHLHPGSPLRHHQSHWIFHQKHVHLSGLAAMTAPQTSEELTNDPIRKLEQKERKMKDRAWCFGAHVQCSRGSLRNWKGSLWRGWRFWESQWMQREEQPVPWFWSQFSLQAGAAQETHIVQVNKSLLWDFKRSSLALPRFTNTQTCKLVSI